MATVCALAGAGAGIAGSTAATSNKPKPRASSAARALRAGGPGRPGRGFGRERAVHVEATVLNDAGTAYITRTVDNGVVKAVAGQELTITEGTTKVPYKDVTVTVPAAATVMRNGSAAALSDLQAGDRVFVSASSDGTRVFAGDARFRPQRGGGPRELRGGPDDDGPGGPPGAFPGHP